LLGVFVLVALIPAVATERASVEFIFTHFNTENGMGIRDKAYILLIGLLMSQYAMAGYDTSAHMVRCDFAPRHSSPYLNCKYY
jgi:hypothetical protein